MKFTSLVVVASFAVLITTAQNVATEDCKSVSFYDGSDHQFTYPIDVCFERNHESGAILESRMFVCDGSTVYQYRWIGVLGCPDGVSPTVLDACADMDLGTGTCEAVGACNLDGCDHFFMEQYSGVTACDGTMATAYQNISSMGMIEDMCISQDTSSSISFRCSADETGMEYVFYTDSSDCSGTEQVLFTMATDCDVTTGEATALRCDYDFNTGGGGGGKGPGGKTGGGGGKGGGGKTAAYSPGSWKMQPGDALSSDQLQSVLAQFKQQEANDLYTSLFGLFFFVVINVLLVGIVIGIYHLCYHRSEKTVVQFDVTDDEKDVLKS